MPRKPDTPHFDSPFTITKDGAAVVEQNSPEEVRACVRNIVLCPVGFRVERSDFGIQSPQFGDVPLPTSQIQQDIEALEPRATEEITEQALGNDQERALAVRIHSTQSES